MSDSWYKVDNVAKVFLATASQRDPRVFRVSCTLQEDIDSRHAEHRPARHRAGMAAVPGDTAPRFVLALF